MTKPDTAVVKRKQLEEELEIKPYDPDQFPVLSSFPSLEEASNALPKKGGVHTPTVQSRQLVANMAACGIPVETIVQVFNTTKHTLEKHYARELEVSRALANSQLAARIYERAMTGTDKASASLAMFWMKANANWRDMGPVPQDDPKNDEEVQETTTIKERLIERVRTTTKVTKKRKEKDPEDDTVLIEQDDTENKEE